MRLKYCSQNILQLNITKTYFMRFIPKIYLYSHIECKSIRATDTVKVLGITLDPKLTWEPHIKILCTKNYMYQAVLRLLYLGLLQLFFNNMV